MNIAQSVGSGPRMDVVLQGSPDSAKSGSSMDVAQSMRGGSSMNIAQSVRSGSRLVVARISRICEERF